VKLLPVEEQKYFSKARWQLNEAHEELIHTGFLNDAVWNKGQDDFLLLYTPGKKAVGD
jgi:hypothetical protein